MYIYAYYTPYTFTCREVHVYRLISKDTVEAAMLAQADRKLELEKQIQRKAGAVLQICPKSVFSFYALFEVYLPYLFL